MTLAIRRWALGALASLATTLSAGAHAQDAPAATETAPVTPEAPAVHDPDPATEPPAVDDPDPAPEATPPTAPEDRFARHRDCADALRALAHPGDHARPTTARDTGRLGTLFLGRYDAFRRRCVPARGDDAPEARWRLAVDHAPVVLDPILEPAFLLGPAIGLAADSARYGDVTARGAAWLEENGRRGGARTSPRASWWRFSDGWTAATASLAALPLLTSRGNARLTDTLILAETVFVDAALVHGIALRLARPRPWASGDVGLWAPGTQDLVTSRLGGPDPFLSSPNLPTSLTAATTVGLATTWAARHKPSAWWALPFGLAAGATTLTGVAEWQAARGTHGDIALGAVIGATVGAFVPLSHAAVAAAIRPDRLARLRARRQVQLQLDLRPNGASVSGVW
jgi:hypothetical protein